MKTLLLQAKALVFPPFAGNSNEKILERKVKQKLMNFKSDGLRNFSFTKIYGPVMFSIFSYVNRKFKSKLLYFHLRQVY